MSGEPVMSGAQVVGGAPGRARAGRGASIAGRVALTVPMLAMLLYCLLPLVWLLVNATKSNAGLLESPGLWFADDFALFDNVREVFAYQDGVYGRWFLNTLLYAVLGAGGATAIAAMGGYALAVYDFPGGRVLFAVVLGAITVPTTALAVPTFLLFTKLGLVNTPWAVLIPALASPFGLYLMRVYAADAVPVSMLEAARLDGAGELRIFLGIALRLLRPGLVTVLLFTLVATWNNYFLPLIVLSEPEWYPLTVGLNQWNSQLGSAAGGQAVYNLVITGSLVAIVPLVAAFLLLQRHWRSGLSAGAVKQ
ncbi:carbohydrate ABC transporter permease [Planomonospora sp. ID82291]|nr:carbohydrate ABC transporter permease [Planomonospora sp. ID82291]